MKSLKTGLLFLILCIVSSNSFSQAPVKNYDAQWKTVDGFIKKNLPKSAFTEVKKIYDLAKKEKQEAQVIKALAYMTTLQQETRENNEVLSIKEVEKEIQVSKEPATSILNGFLAELYWGYFLEHRWEFFNRTQTVAFQKDDIATWAAEDFYKKISELFLKSVANEKLLQQTKLEPFDAIIEKGNVRHLRPTLFDLLAVQALGFFQNDTRDLNKPAYSFEIDQASAFDPAADFITQKFITKDSSSLYHKALLLYQSLLSFHLKDAKPDALIDADLQRLEFVKNNSVHPDKDQLYFNAINHIARQYGNLPAASYAWTLLALWYENKAKTYVPGGDSTHRYDLVKAKEICERIIAQKDSSQGKFACYNMLQRLNMVNLQFSVEKVNIPGQPFRAFVNYKNFNTLYLRIIKPDEDLKKVLENRFEEKYWASMLASKPVRAWQQSLPVTNDLQQHSTEIKIDALPFGDYILIASTDNSFSGNKNIIAAQYFYVSNISFVNRNEDYFVLNRDNGQPLPGATVQVWNQQYSSAVSRYIREKGKQYKTDANGFFRKEKDNDVNRNNNYQLEITFGNERFFMNEMTNDYYYYPNNNIGTKNVSTIFLFLDRSIYRPGQTLYFKGISLTRNEGEKKADILTGYETVAYLSNTNGQVIDSMKLKSNEYGSFSGKFQLPQSGLNGQYSLSTKKDRSYISFRVEEYKRPKFYVDYEPVKETYKVNDKIKVTGSAKAYAGNNIDGALVKYRVTRHSRFLYPWMFRWWYPPSEPMEIAHGEATTDANGKFVIEFTAIPDLKVDKKFEPVFDYAVHADITDINGETRSGDETITAGYKSLLIKSTVPNLIAVDSLKTISIRTENMNGEFQPADVKVTITQLKQENRLIRSRYWNRPDQFVMTKAEYIRYFPHDEYDNESDYKTWDKGAIVFEKMDSVKVNSEFKIQDPELKPGFYVIEMVAKDKNGEEVKDVKYVELYDDKSNQLGKPQYIWNVATKAIEPGEKTIAKLGSSADNLFVVQLTDRSTSYGLQTQKISYNFFKLNNEKKNIDITATEADRGGYGITWMFVKHNRAYNETQVIEVPWTNKELNIEYATYRDKTLPGSEEKWKLRITGYKNEKVAAEILASMYDASLDQFNPHAWSKPYIWPNYVNHYYFNSYANFTKIESFVKPHSTPEFKTVDKRYDMLIGAPNIKNELFAYGGDVRSDNRRDKAFMLAAPTAAQEQSLSKGAPRVSNGLLVEPLGYDFVSNKLDAPASMQEKLPDVAPAGDVQIRKNFNETAFFFPDLRTDETGAIEFSFTLPDALTKWKFQALSHTKDLAFGYSSKEIITQKQLMVQPNAPRFLREGDKIEFSAKVVNLTEKPLKGQAELQLFDAATNQPVNGLFKHTNTSIAFNLQAGQSLPVKFPIEIPYNFNKALTWKIVASGETVSDGEENSLPVLTNRMLVTETMPLPMIGSGSKEFKFDKLINSGNSKTLQQYSLTVEYTSNPAWYAVQALPYLMEYPYECAEQLWSRYYANSLATMIANSSPRIKQIFEQWKTKDTAALMSNLLKNQELKSILLEETPWVLQAKTESEQKRNIALLFDMVRMSNELNGSLEKIRQMQISNGGFVWFKGGPDDRYMTQYIVTGIGHLKKLNAVAKGQETALNRILSTAVAYLDKKLKEDYVNIIKNKNDLKKYVPDYSQVHYLYMRSFFPDIKIPAATQTAYNYFRTRTQQNWTTQNKYMQGMIALALHRTGDIKTPKAILASLKETSIVNEELGMYWKDARRSWWWYEAPIERQSLLIEAFQEIAKDSKTVDNLRTWLLKNKQTNNWESTKATAEACYALLLQGSQWLASEPNVTIKLGGTTISSASEPQQAGTGYFKKTIETEKIDPSMGNVSVTVKPAQPQGTVTATWGAVYWQYFEDLDKITSAATPLSLSKKLFVERNSDRGPVLTPVNDGDKLKIGDKIKVRVELRVDRDMEYMHMKDMRASCMEPVNVLSNYKWQGGLGYYESTKDASTNFFFNHLRKGTYVFEYPLFVTHTGNFSNGITTIQSMYAPEFSSHSEGVRVTIE